MPNKELREPVKIKSDGLTIKKKYPDIGRNDLCPCNSGKKVKHCCLLQIENGYNKLIRKN